MGICVSKTDVDQFNELKSANFKVKDFSLNGKNMWGKVVYVYDGDTVHIVFKINDNLVKFNCRLLGIDSSEIISKNLQNHETGIKSRNYLISKVINIPIEKETMNKNEIKTLCSQSSKLVWIKAYHFDKYGRLLVELFDAPNSSKSFNQDMIDKKYAVKYNGGTKK